LQQELKWRGGLPDESIAMLNAGRPLKPACIRERAFFAACRSDWAMANPKTI